MSGCDDERETTEVHLRKVFKTWLDATFCYMTIACEYQAWAKLVIAIISNVPQRQESLRKPKAQKTSKCVCVAHIMRLGFGIKLKGEKT